MDGASNGASPGEKGFQAEACSRPTAIPLGGGGGGDVGETHDRLDTRESRNLMTRPAGGDMTREKALKKTDLEQTEGRPDEQPNDMRAPSAYSHLSAIISA